MTQEKGSWEVRIVERSGGKATRECKTTSPATVVTGDVFSRSLRSRGRPMPAHQELARIAKVLQDKQNVVNAVDVAVSSNSFQNVIDVNDAVTGQIAVAGF